MDTAIGTFALLHQAILTPENLHKKPFAENNFTPETFYTRGNSNQWVFKHFSPDSFYNRMRTHQKPFTPKSSYAKRFLHQKTFTLEYVCTIHTKEFYTRF